MHGRMTSMSEMLDNYPIAPLKVSVTGEKADYDAARSKLSGFYDYRGACWVYAGSRGLGVTPLVTCVRFKPRSGENLLEFPPVRDLL